jgi:hypothetical protein
MSRNRVTLAVFAVFLLSTLPALAQRGEGPLRNIAPAGTTVDQIIQRFAAREKQFALAREHYTYEEAVTVQTLEGDTVDGEYRQTWDVNFNGEGKRYLTVTYAPQPTLTRVTMTQEDLNDIQNLMPFVLTSDELPEYNITYLGQQTEDELNTYVLDISPKHIEKNRRYFDGRIWVDDHDLQIVKTYGKSVPDFHNRNGENLFPRFTTYRQQIDNAYWFPTYTRADDVLHFSSGDVRIRIIVRYTKYKRFGSNVRITYEGQDVKPAPGTPAPQAGGSDRQP